VSAGGEPEWVIVVTTLGAPQRRRFGGKRPRAVEGAPEPEPVPTHRATLISPAALASEEEAARWLEGMRRDRDALYEEVERAALELSTVLRAHRAAAADPYVREVTIAQANVVRVGYGDGDRVADGRWAAAYAVPHRHERRKRAEALRPQERFAALLGGSEWALVGEELLLRARLDLDAGRLREAALQARIALEALLAELGGDEAGELAAYRGAIGDAANAALGGDLDEELERGVRDAVDEMRRVLRRRQLSDR
jgi:hypothetical protein